jgi:hypothetical protein
MIKKLLLTGLLLCVATILPLVANADMPESVTKVSVHQITEANGKKIVQITLFNPRNNQPITPADLKEVHTKKVHLLIIDNELQDYVHVHPQATNTPGLYTFDWQPKTNGHYRVWADIFPLDTNAQEYLITDLTKPSDKKPDIDRTVSLKKEMGGFTFQLSFKPETLKVGRATMGTLSVSDSQGRPVTKLEPLMGAFAHIVAFEDDFKTILHIHPMGKEPKSASERGGPKLQFHLEPERAGFIKLFAQVVIDGKEFFVPFGIIVRE